MHRTAPPTDHRPGRTLERADLDQRDREERDTRAARRSVPATRHRSESLLDTLVMEHARSLRRRGRARGSEVSWRSVLAPDGRS